MPRRQHQRVPRVRQDGAAAHHQRRWRHAWEAVDNVTARLVIPFGETEDRFTVTFEAATGLLRRLEAPRYRSAGDLAKTLWWIEPRGWRTFGGLRLPSPVALTWQDEGTPWLVMTVEDVVYDEDVSRTVQPTGP